MLRVAAKASFPAGVGTPQNTPACKTLAGGSVNQQAKNPYLLVCLAGYIFFHALTNVVACNGTYKGTDDQCYHVIS
jgi:hypothetical protein